MVSPVCRLKRRICEGDVDVVGAGQVGGVGRAQEAEAVGQHFQRTPSPKMVSPFLAAVLQQREDQFLLAQPVGALDAVRGHVEQLADV
jgi:hypothetical protein